MAIEVKVPLLPESIADATVSTWHKKVGDTVSRDENLVDLETDKVMLEVPAPTDGIIKEIKYQTGSKVKAQEVLALIEAQSVSAKPIEKEAVKEAVKETKSVPFKEEASSKTQTQTEVMAEPSATNLSPKARRQEAMSLQSQPKVTSTTAKTASPTVTVSLGASSRPEKRVPMTRMRARIAERLLSVKQNTAMLTTFNEIDMTHAMEMRKRYKDKFEKRYQVKLGFMSFFVKACVEALKRLPVVNASLDGNDIIYHGYYDIGVAVSTDRGLIVPVLRDADKMSMAEIESKIGELAQKARTGKLALEEMQGGTFTITNGGVFGSLMATPLLNSPQCAILGMHKIEERPVVVEGQIVIRPMMYVALSYDHQIIDGKESVTFLVSVKELLEDPSRLVLEV